MKKYHFVNKNETLERIYEMLDQITEDFDRHSLDEISLQFEIEKIGSGEMVIVTARTGD